VAEVVVIGRARKLRAATSHGAPTEVMDAQGFSHQAERYQARLALEDMELLKNKTAAASPSSTAA
jgi:hypothetical protein